MLPDKSEHNSAQLLSLAEASIITGYNQDYLGQLARSGELRAQKIGRNWTTTREAVEELMARRNIFSQAQFAEHAAPGKIQVNVIRDSAEKTGSSSSETLLPGSSVQSQSHQTQMLGVIPNPSVAMPATSETDQDELSSLPQTEAEESVEVVGLPIAIKVKSEALLYSSSRPGQLSNSVDFVKLRMEQTQGWTQATEELKVLRHDLETELSLLREEVVSSTRQDQPVSNDGADVVAPVDLRNRLASNFDFGTETNLPPIQSSHRNVIKTLYQSFPYKPAQPNMFVMAVAMVAMILGASSVYALKDFELGKFMGRNENASFSYATPPRLAPPASVPTNETEYPGQVLSHSVATGSYYVPMTYSEADLDRMILNNLQGIIAAGWLTGQQGPQGERGPRGRIGSIGPQGPSGISDPGFALGSIAFQGGAGLAEDNANLFYDDTTNSLGLGTNTPHASAILELSSTSRGLLAPRMTTVQRDAIVGPATGLLIYNTTSNEFNVFDGGSWTAITGGGGGSTDWSDLTNPTGNLALSMQGFSTTFTYGNATGATNLFTLADTAANTGTGYLFNLNTAAGSTLRPLRVSVNGGTDALTINAAGLVTANNLASSSVAITGGSINATPIGGVTPASGAFTTVNGTTINASTALQTAGVNRMDASGNLVNVGNLTAGAALTIASSGAGNDIIIDGADAFIVQDSSTFNGTVAFGSTTTFQADDIVDAEVSNTLTSSIFIGPGSTTNVIDLGTTEVAGTLTVPNGGTGATSLTGVLLGNGVSPFTATTTSAGIAGALSDETGSGALVFASSPTLTSPRFADGGFLADASGNELLIFDSNASAVNEITISNAATGNGVTIAATGGDADVALSINSKGAGVLNLNGVATGDILLGGGSASTGCTLTNATGAFACSGSLSGSNFSGSSSGTNTGDVTLAGQNYLSLAGQVITANPVDLSGTNVTGILAAARFPALTGDVTTVAGSLATTIAANAVALGTDTTGDYVATITAGTGLTGDATGEGSTPTISVNTASGVTTSGDNVVLDTNFNPTWTADHTWTLAGAEDLAISHDGTGGTADAVNISVAPSSSAGTLNGLVVSQGSSANTNPLDAAVRINNLDNDVGIPAAIQIANTGGGGYTSIIDNQGTLISGAEINLLDGHDAALVDTNDAVNTAITGTGALNSGSITSGFGSIDVGTDAISTTGTITGGTINATTTLQTGGTARIDASGNLTNIGNITATAGIIIASTGANDITLQARGANTTGFINIGDVSANPDILVVGVKNTAGNPTGADGGIYYNSNSGKFFIQEGGTWKEVCNKADAACGAGSGSTWNGLTAPTGNLTLVMDADTTTFNWTATAGLDPFSMTFANNSGSANTQNGLILVNAVTAQTGDVNTESILKLDNADTSAAGSTVVDDAILITNSGGITNGITDAIDVSAAEIVNAINVGPNNILGTTAVIDFTNFDVDGSGLVTTASDLAVNGGDITSSGTLTLNASSTVIIPDANAFQTNDITPTSALTVGATGQTLTLQGSTALITSTGAGNDIALTSADQIILNAGSSIALQDNTDITGNLDVSGTIQVGSGNITLTDATGNIQAGAYAAASIDGDDINSSLAGAGLVLTAGSPDTLDIGAGAGITVNANDIAIDQSFSPTWTGTHTFQTDANFNLAGTENVLLTSDLAGTVDLFNIQGTPAAGANVASGIYIDQINSANGNGFDTAIVIDNSDTNLAIGTGIQFIDAGGGFTTFLDTPSLDITGAGAITGAAGFNGLIITANTGVITSGTWNGTALTDAFVSDTLTSSIFIGSGSTTNAIDLATAEVAGILPIANGGTNAATSQGAINNISQLTTEGDLLYHNGTNSTRLPRGNNGECLTANTTTIIWASCNAGGGDNIAVNGTSVVDGAGADFIDTAASGTVAGVSWALNTGGSPDTIAVTIGTASATEAGIITTGTQTLAGDKTFNGAVVLQSTLSANGVATFNTDVDFVLAGSENLNLSSTVTGTTAVDLFSFALTNQTSSGTQRGIVLTNLNDVANAVTESLILIDNAEATAATLTDAIRITSSGVNGGVVDAVDASDSNIDNALNAGPNTIQGTTAVIDFTNFDVDASGNTDLGGTLAVGTGNAFTINSSGAITAVTGITNTGTLNTTVQSATALTVARTGTNYALQVDTNTASSVTGLKVTAAAAGGGLALTTISSGTDENLTLDAKGAGTISIGASSTGDILLAGGSGATGCTITNSNGNLTCAGSITTTNTSGAVGFWSRNNGTTTLSPVTSGDSLTTSGNFSTTGSGTITAAGLLTGNGGLTVVGTALINNSGTANTTIGNSAGGTITIGASTGSDLVLQDAQWNVTGAGAANFGSIGSVTPGSGAFTTLSASGAIAANGGVTVSNGQTLAANGTVNLGDNGDAITLDGNGTVTINDATIALSNQATDIDIRDNTGSSFTVSEAANNYFLITTTNGAPVVTLDTLEAGGTMNFGSANVTRTINIGTGTGADTIHIGEGGTNANTITIGTDAVANTITIGSSSATGVSVTDDNWSITTGGLITTASNLAVNGGTISSTAGTLTINAAGTVDVTDTLNADALTSDAGVSIGAGNAYTGAGAVTLSSGAAAALTLDSASNSILIAATDTTLQRTAAGIYTINLVDGSDTTLALTNSGAGNVRLSVDNLAGGGTQCLQTDNNGVVTGTGSACGTGGGSSALDALTAATTDDAAILSGDNTIIWEWALTSATSKGFTIGESAASTGGSGNQHLLQLNTDSGSTAGPLEIVSNSADSGDIEFNLNNSGDFEIQDAGTAFAVFDDTGGISFSPQGTSDFIINTDGNSQVGIGTAAVSDYLVSIDGTTANDHSRIIDITQANDANEDTTAINIANTVNSGTVSSDTRTITNFNISLTPTVTAASGTDLNSYGTLNSVNLSNITITTSLNNITSYGDRVMVTGSPVINSVSGSDSIDAAAQFGFANLSPVLTSVTAGSTYTTRGGIFTNNSTSPGNANLNSTAFGVQANAIGDLTTDAATIHYGGHFTAGGTADINVGMYATASGATNNYAAIFEAGNVGIGLTAPTSLLHIQQAADSTNVTTPIAFDINSVGASGELTASSGTQTFARIAPTVNQTSTAGYTALLINSTETSTGSGDKNLLDLQVGSASKLAVANTGSATFAAGANILQNAGWFDGPYGGFGVFQNLLKRSEEFDDDTDWIKSNVNDPTANTQTAPDGSVSAEILSTTSSGGNYCNFSATDAASNTFTFSIWVKSASSTQNFGLRLDAGPTSCATANTVTGTESTFTATTSWKRYSVTQTFSGVTATHKVKARIFPGTAGGSSAVDIYGWGAQLEQSSSMNVYATTSTATIANVNRGAVDEANLTAVSGSLFGGRQTINILGAAVANSVQIGQLIRMNDNTTSGLGTTEAQALQVLANRGTNVNGINTGIFTEGYTFGIEARTTAQGDQTVIPAAVFAYLNQASGQEAVGNAIHAFTDTATGADLLLLDQEVSAFSGNGMLMNFGLTGGSFTGNFLRLQEGGSDKLLVDDTGQLKITVDTADNTESILVDTNESTGSVTVFRIQSDVASGNTDKFHINASGATFISFVNNGTAAVCHANNGQTTNDELVDCNPTAGADYMEIYPTDSGVGTGDVVVSGNDRITTTQGDEMVKLSKSAAAYQGNIVGVVSNPDDAGDFNTIGYNIRQRDNPQPIALAGRVQVKVTIENGVIQPGDYLTSSGTQAGYAMKASAPGMVVGQALGFFDGSGGNTVMVFINPMVYDPTILVDTINNILEMQRGTMATQLFATTTSGAASLIDQQGSGDVLQLKTGGVDRFLVQNNGTVNINTEVSDPTQPIFVVRNAAADLLSLNSRGDATFAGNIIIKDDNLAGSVVTQIDGTAEIIFSYDLGTGKPAVQLTPESDSPVFAQILEWRRDNDGNYTGFVMKTFGLDGQSRQSIVHYLVVGKQADYETFGLDTLGVVTAPQGPPIIVGGPSPVTGSGDNDTLTENIGENGEVESNGEIADDSTTVSPTDANDNIDSTDTAPPTEVPEISDEALNETPDDPSTATDEAASESHGLPPVSVAPSTVP